MRGSTCPCGERIGRLAHAVVEPPRDRPDARVGRQQPIRVRGERGAGMRPMVGARRRPRNRSPGIAPALAAGGPRRRVRHDEPARHLRLRPGRRRARWPRRRPGRRRRRRLRPCQLAVCDLDGRSVCVIVPDGTRSCPLPLLLAAVHGALPAARPRLTVLVALGTHAPMSEAQLARHLGYPAGDLAGRYPGLTVLNHEWADPATFVSLGTIPPERIGELSEGRLRVPVDVRLNRRGRGARRGARRRPGVPARSGGLLGRQQVLLPRGRRARRSSTSRTGSGR